MIPRVLDKVYHWIRHQNIACIFGTRTVRITGKVEAVCRFDQRSIAITLKIDHQGDDSVMSIVNKYWGGVRFRYHTSRLRPRF